MKKFKVTVDGHTYLVEVEETEVTAEQKTVGTSEEEIAAKPVVTPAPMIEKENPVSESKEKDLLQPAAGNGLEVKAPMPGSVLDVPVQVGDKVSEGDILLILEAMKMENELTAPQNGTVSAVLVKKGDTVNSGDPLIMLS
ncbi:MAG: biotin/lipoyl-containing protein [Bacillota bacterium]|nr:biotin/lipoyl-containing protein [Bacillota bacterium]